MNGWLVESVSRRLVEVTRAGQDGHVSSVIQQRGNVSWLWEEVGKLKLLNPGCGKLDDGFDEWLVCRGAAHRGCVEMLRQHAEEVAAWLQDIGFTAVRAGQLAVTGCALHREHTFCKPPT